MEKLWWKKQIRIIQYNLQMKDTPMMDAEKIARETEEMAGDAIVINVADSVTWYPTEVKYVKVNEYLPKGEDLIERLLIEAHKRNIKVFARMMTTCMEEDIYHQKPQWAARRPDGSPVIMGKDRPGLWYALYQCCPNSGYWQDVGIKLILEAFKKYDFDGLFGITGSFCFPCWCDKCKSMYMEKYGKQMPDDVMKYEPDWISSQGKNYYDKFAEAFSKIYPDKPSLRYYWPFDLDLGLGFKMPADDIDLVSKEGNTLCTEAQDILSLGVTKLPEWNTPALRMKMGRTIEKFPPPVGIIHTCPGMDWRHSCMPEAEFMYWAAQIPANGGSYWTTFTGYPDTISDKRMLKAVGKLNGMIQKIVDDMEDAKSICEVMLLSDNDIYVQGWAEALMCAHIDFDMLAHYQLSYERIEKYAVVIIPKKFKYPAGSNAIFEKYVSKGGRLIVEGTVDADLSEVKNLLGISGSVVCSEDMTNAYLRIEQAGKEIQNIIGEADLIPLRGKVGFCEPCKETITIASWVPPFANIASSGIPERASLPVSRTDIPLCTVRDYKKGRVMFIAYEPSRLIKEYAISDMYTMIRGYVEYMLGSDKKITLYAPGRIIMTVFGKENKVMFHLVNGIGQRPLQDTIPCYNIKMEMILYGKNVRTVQSKIAQRKIDFEVEGDVLKLKLEYLETWDMILVEFS